MPVKVPLEIEELHLQIRGRPEQRAVQALSDLTEPEVREEVLTLRRRVQKLMTRLRLVLCDEPQGFVSVASRIPI